MRACAACLASSPPALKLGPDRDTRPQPKARAALLDIISDSPSPIPSPARTLSHPSPLGPRRSFSRTMNDERSNGSVPLIPLSSSRRRDYARLSEDNDPYSYNDNDHDNDGSFHDHNNNYSSQKHNNLDIDTSYQGPRSYTYPQQEQLHHHHHHHDQQQQQQQPPTMMSNLRSAAGISKKGSISVMASYAFDWAIILIVLGIAYWWNDHEPNRRPFSLEDPNIS